MRSRVLILAVTVVLASGSAAQTKAEAKPDVEVRTRTTAAGSATETVSLIKGPRMRQEHVTTAGPGIVLLFQCDQTRLLQISPAHKTYRVIPLLEMAAASAASQGAPARSPRPARAGDVTFNTTLRDTGLRRKMRGYVARNIKTETATEAPAGSCAAAHRVKMSSDGWYVDFPGVDLACADGDRAALRLRPEDPTCPVRPRFRSVGKARLGFPISLTTTMTTSKGEVMVKQETLSLETTTLDAALFEVPEAYRRVDSEAALFEPAEQLTAVEPSAPAEGLLPLRRSSRSTRTGEARPALPRVCLVRVSTPKQEPPASFWLQLNLGLNRAGIEPVTLEAKPDALPEKLETEAKEKSCQYLLSVDSPEPLHVTYKLQEGGGPQTVRLESSVTVAEGETLENAAEKIAVAVAESIQRATAERKPIP